MKKNMGKIDRILRVLAALLIAILYFSGQITGTLGTVLLIFAVIFLITSVISYCPLYAPFGIKTRKVQ